MVWRMFITPYILFLVLIIWLKAVYRNQTMGVFIQEAVEENEDQD